MYVQIYQKRHSDVKMRLLYRHELPKVLSQVRLNDAGSNSGADFEAGPVAAGGRKHVRLVHHGARTLDLCAAHEKLDACELRVLLPTEGTTAYTSSFAE